ncbi:MAG: EAL domain-containing protein, partial [Micrococcales bacterium]|nr:EAL domain-containing protein [Micrococcales bacterium]
MQQSTVDGPLSALGSGQHGLYLFYQPFYNLSTGRLQGHEALLRQRIDGSSSFSPPSGLLPFLDAEQLLRLDGWVARSATTQLADWRSSHRVSERILAVNISVPSLLDPVFINGLTEHLSVLDIPLDRVLFDIHATTLSTLALDADVRTRIHNLRTRGFTFCIDGIDGVTERALDAGFWSCVDIAKFSPHLLAADPLDTASTQGRFDELCEALHDRDLPILVTGIETPAHLELARSRGCEWAQG